MGKVIALDIGGTNTRVAVVNENFEVENLVINPTVPNNTEAFLDNVKKTVLEACHSFDDVISLVAGVPGRVRYDGFIEALPNVHIYKVPLAEFLTSNFKKPTFVINDAEAAALAESNIGALKNFESLYFVTISTGVGGAFTVKGKLAKSSYEVGHTLTEYKGEYHEFEHLTSGTGILNMFKTNHLDIGSAKDFFALVKEKKPEVMPCYRDWLALMAGWINMINDTFQPEVFALTGGVMKSSDVFFDDLKALAPKAHLEKTSSGQNAGLLGAAVLGFQNK